MGVAFRGHAVEATVGGEEAVGGEEVEVGVEEEEVAEGVNGGDVAGGDADVSLGSPHFNILSNIRDKVTPSRPPVLARGPGLLELPDELLIASDTTGPRHTRCHSPQTHVQWWQAHLTPDRCRVRLAPGNICQ